ncbi:hypothetical protein [Synechococcus sp. PCC 6312]|uniref:MGH1-like glycoside hydrolase domain-containing protein n=1 Tax=Synechococcus sp. (strain ATCC 27167 / PCC 6312) TaxID=195253 RepID=UPI00029F1A9A|nr:hypothetical protein [Synechococcus sp. PCC 6312]AFY61115.1 hypothetical protein Syn6312_1982 [Synechococcus sp. PCC 6312]
MSTQNIPEIQRLNQAKASTHPWRKWGPYLSERQWGTVREDYSTDGNAWDYFSHDQARSRAYRWGEDGLAGICDDQQQLCFGLALWNGVDPIIKERLFGLTNSEGNHGEDVKEYYFYLDSTPTHSYMKYLYKYPQREFPYDDLVQTNARRGYYDQEYELLDTGVFDENHYFDVFVEYAKESPEDWLIQIEVFNRGDQAASLHVLPSIWFRNTWSWFKHPVTKPQLRQTSAGIIAAQHPELGTRYLSCHQAPPLLFTENETNLERVFGLENLQPYVKDGINNYLVHGQTDAVNPSRVGTKAAADYFLEIPAGGSQIIQVRLGTTPNSDFGPAFTKTFQARRQEADEFFGKVIPDSLSPDAKNIARQAIAGMMWTKQYYNFPVKEWLEDEILPPDCPERLPTRNKDWFHLESSAIISMPDKWEYPWFAAWDLAFHCAALCLVDMEFTKEQLCLMVDELHLHPNGQLPAYEWNFGDVNPPVHAISTYQIYMLDKALNGGQGDRVFLESVFHKLLLNFTWWVNRKDASGNNVFEGGFLGLDNIGVFDRSAPLPMGGRLEQADGTSWMAMYSLDMLNMAVELALDNPAYEDLCCKFYEHFIYIAGAMDRVGNNKDELWDEEDGFFYDILHLPDGRAQRLKVRSMVGLIPLCATAVVSDEILERLPKFKARIAEFNARHPELLANINDPNALGVKNRHLFCPVGPEKLRRILSKMLDESEFLSDYGLRSLSRYHLEHPYKFVLGRDIYRVDYLPAESTSGMFGGNSNWRGPVWMPVNAIIVQALRKMYGYYGDEFKVECPTGSGNWLTLWDVSDLILTRLNNIFLQTEERRPVYGETEKFQTDPHWRDLILFYEYFHGDNGAGIGASHQTGWTGLIARYLVAQASLSSKEVLEKTYMSAVSTTIGTA